MKEAVSIAAVETARFTMDYAVFGRGARPFLIIPGMGLQTVIPGAAEAVAELYRTYAELYKVYIIEWRRELPAGHSVRDMARDIAETMEALGIKEADVFSASLGGMIAQVLAAEYPELVHKVVLGSTLALPNELQRENFAEWIELAKAGDPVPLNRSFARRVYSPETQAARRELFAAIEGMGTPEEMRRFITLAEACRDFSYYEELAKIRCPVLVLGGGKDLVFGEEASVKIAEKLGCPCYIYENCAHAAYDEAPDYLERMLRFFLGIRRV